MEERSVDVDSLLHLRTLISSGPTATRLFSVSHGRPWAWETICALGLGMLIRLAHNVFFSESFLMQGAS